MRRFAIPVLLAPALIAAGCSARAARITTPTGTLAELRNLRPGVQDVRLDIQDVRMEDGPNQAIDLAMQQYRLFLKEAPGNILTPVAMRRLADLQVEKQFGIPAGENAGADPNGPVEAIALYDRLLAEYPDYEQRDKVLYQKARAYDELGRTEEALETMDSLIRANPNSEHYEEVQFRRAEYFFTRNRYRDADNAYSSLIKRGPASAYYEFALYKLGWTFYKQEAYEEALHKFMALLDYKLSADFDHAHAEEGERRVADTYRAISLSFSNLGGPDAVRQYYATFGKRSYEDRVYSNLGEHYLENLRYDDAAKVYKAFVELYPFHREAPRLSMRAIETFTQGGFPQLVLESKREFASRYGLKAEYWRHFKAEEAPEVLAYVKANLKDLATHYHAQYQNGTKAPDKNDAKLADYREARHWYGEYLESFPTDPDSPTVNLQLADLLLENRDFGDAAKEYERTAYDYPMHPRSAAAGYAAVYAYRQKDSARPETIASSLKFANAFPDHEQTAKVLEAAADDMYEMKDYRHAIDTAQRVIDTYPRSDAAVLRSAWIVVAHGSFELAEYPQAERAYTEVLAVTPERDASRAALVDNLAASIYKQGDRANEAQDYRAAANHFLRIREAAPTSAIRASAEYDAGAALIRLQDWTAAAGVLEAFRKTFPKHELQLEATKQIAHAYRQNGQLARAAGEYDSLASQSKDSTLRSEALLIAGDLYAQSNAQDRAVDVYTRYIKEFPRPVETAIETRLKIAEIHKTHDEPLYLGELKEIVRIDAGAGAERTGRTRTLAARSSLVLAEQIYKRFLAVKLQQPFESSLKEKQQRMDAAIEAMGRLVEYEIAELTAAATYYMAETYFSYSRSLVESERPTGLKPAQLAEYELDLDEAAFPFEEKAISVHEKNMEMLHAGVLNAWTEKSLSRLAALMPARYAKSEVTGGFVGTFDSAIVSEGGTQDANSQ